MRKGFWLLGLIVALTVMADTPPPAAVKIKGGTDGTNIGNTGDSLKTTATVSGTVGVTQSTSPWVTSRDWDLNFSSDQVDASGSTVDVSNFPASQNVVVTSSALPAGAATSLFQSNGNASLASIDAKLETTVNGLKVDGSAVTQPVSAVSLPLPSGASTSALQTSGNVTLSSIDSNLSSIDGKLNSLGQKTMANSVPVVISSDQSAVPASQSGAWSVSVNNAGDFNIGIVDQGAPGASPWLVDGSGVVQPVSGTVAATQSGTWNINNVSGTVSLPTGASTSANQTTGNALLSSINTKIDTTVNGIKVDGSAVTQPVSAVSLPLPTGAATSALQTTGNASLVSIDTDLNALASIDGKLNSLGQKTMAASVPVVIASDQSGLAVSQSGTWNINNVSGTVSLPTGASTSANQVTTNASLASIDADINTTLSSRASEATLATRASEATLSTLNGKVANDFGLASGAIRTASQIGNASGGAAFGAGTTSAQTLRVVLPTDQSAIPASQSGTWNIADITGTVSLPTGAATEAKQDTGNASLASIDTDFDVALSTRATEATLATRASEATLATRASEATLSSLNGKVANDFGASSGAVRSAAQVGNATGAADFNAGTTGAQTLRVVLPTDQSAIPATQSGTWNINNVSGTVSLPTGASTSANQVTANASLASIDTDFDVALSTRASEATLSSINGKLNSLGQKTMANSVPVVISSDQSNVPVSQATASSLNAQVVGNVASAASDSGNPVKVGAVFNSTLPTFTNGQRADLQTNKFGELAVSTRNLRFRQAGATTGTQVVTGSGRLHSVCVTVFNGGGTIDIYDNTSATGTQLFELDPSNNNAAQVFCTPPLGLEYSTGLFIVTTGAGQNFYLLYQ